MADLKYTKIEEQFKDLKNRIEGLHKNPNEFMDWLKFQLEFKNLSTMNKNMVYFQNPKATYVASYSKWEKLGFFPQGAGVGLRIFCPVFHYYFIDGLGKPKPIKIATKEEREKINRGIYKKTSFISYKFGYVYDISSTNATEEDLLELQEQKPSFELDAFVSKIESWYGVERDATLTDIQNAYTLVENTILKEKSDEFEINETAVELFKQSVMYIVMHFLQFDSQVLKYKSINDINKISFEEKEFEQLSYNITKCAKLVIDEIMMMH